MKIPANSNMYMDAKLAGLRAYEGCIQGDVDADACVVSFGELPEAVSHALEAACAGLGMPQPVWLDVATLAPADAFAAVEGLDSRVVIIADELAAGLLSAGYRAPVALDARGRLLGRSCVAFTSFEADLADPARKQRDWALLKLLKK